MRRPGCGRAARRRAYIDAVRRSCMEKKESILMEVWGPRAGTDQAEETEAEIKAAMDRWMSLPEEERRRLILEDGEERMRQERLSYIP